jgi:glycerol-3-phosphate dehydrogenase
MRGEMLDRLRAGGTWDIAVIGGGATGLGTAVDAAARGHRTVLLEAHDFAKGTSSRSTKLVHGGVRYLAQGRLGLVREALRERGLLRQNAPHLVRELAFVVPAYSWWARPYYGIGLKAYDLLAGHLGFDASRVIGRDEALRRASALRPDGLRGGVVYHDGQFDDARLAIALMRTATDLGASALNYLPVTGLLKEGGRVSGVSARDAETGETFAIAARAVVNATGVFADAVRRLDEPDAPAMIEPSQGVHLVLDRSFLPGDDAVMIPRTDDGRVLFAIPWHGRALVGTTDTPVVRVADEPRALPEEVEFLLGHAARYLAKPPGRADVRSVFAGLRPLIRGGHRGDTSKLSRDHVVAVSATGLVTITGGKWTTYRPMGASAVDHAERVGGLARRPCATASLRLHGWRPQDDPDDGPFALYGSDAEGLALLSAEEPGRDDLLHPGLPVRGVEVAWAVRHEAARTVEDVLSRRTRALLLDARASCEAAPRVAEIMARELGRDAAWQGEQVRRFRALAEGYLLDP